MEERIENVPAFIGGRITQAYKRACDDVNVNYKLITEELIVKIQEISSGNMELSEYERIRIVYNRLADQPNIKSHLATVYRKKLSLLSKIIHQPNKENSHSGRPRLLTMNQEKMVVEHVQNCQRAGKCQTFAEITHWLNKTVLRYSDKKASQKFIQHNNFIMSVLEAAYPQSSEKLRISACVYETFNIFFGKLKEYYEAYRYDSDLIISVAETTSANEKHKRRAKILYDPEINIAPTTSIEYENDNITLCSGISAAGGVLTPCFIIKNTTGRIDATLRTIEFDYGKYTMTSSPSGWQDAVSSRYVLILHSNATLEREPLCSGQQRYFFRIDNSYTNRTKEFY